MTEVKIIVLTNNQHIIGEVTGYKDNETGSLTFTVKRAQTIIYNRDENNEILASMIPFIPASADEVLEFDWAAKLTFATPSPQIKEHYEAIVAPEEPTQLELFQVDEYGEAEEVEVEVVEFDDASGAE